MSSVTQTQTTLRRFLLTLVAGACLAAMPATLLAGRAHATGMRNLDANPDPVRVGNEVTFSVQLVDNNLRGAPLPGKPVTFYVKWNPSLPVLPVGTAITDSNGYARLTLVIPEWALRPNDHAAHRGYTARFEGDAANGRHYHSGKTFTVKR
jgi:hypothetical protein